MMVALSTLKKAKTSMLALLCLDRRRWRCWVRKRQEVKEALDGVQRQEVQKNIVKERKDNVSKAEDDVADEETQPSSDSCRSR
jgi:hypothetical protein